MSPHYQYRKRMILAESLETPRAAEERQIHNKCLEQMEAERAALFPKENRTVATIESMGAWRENRMKELIAKYSAGVKNDY